MHLFYLGLFKTHCREIWGMDISFEDSDGKFTLKKIPLRPPDKEMAWAAEVLTRGDEAALKKCGKSALWHLCLDRNIRRWRASSPVTLIAGKSMRTEERPIAQLPIAESQATEFPVRAPIVGKKDAAGAKAMLQSAVSIESTDHMFFTKDVLISLIKDLNLSTKGNNPDLVSRLLNWRADNVFPQVETGVCVDDTMGMSTKNKLGVDEAKQWFSSQTEIQRADLMEFTVSILSSLCKACSISSRARKDVLVDCLLSWKVHGATDTAAQTKAKQGLKKGVLGRTVLSEVHKDMASTELPSWVSPAPPNLGCAAHSSLSADKWRATCTVHLPITLICLWGGHDDRYYEILSNFIDLVTAVEIGSMLITSPEHVALYDKLML
ncbi:hypothetical protein EW146_g8248 [Bondarzewia mesenterica]|uniref:SAP domain-containing protein n=1 Tax=Bondarzewia mesenterica TaxID=1095465 RepID=A0A4S4LHS0_9AGAM|nr:hypothetical protein EW146_g8248 [Bondarzewia mesenterica]